MSQLYLWAPWIIVVAIAGALVRRRRTLDLRAIAWEAVIVVGSYAVYYVVRGSTQGSASGAIDRAGRIIDIEQWLRIYWEPAWQSFFTGTRASTLFFNWVYIWWHWPFIIIVALWLFLDHPRAYYTYRWAFLASGAVALIFFAAMPVAPPRLATPDIVDTISLHSRAYRSYETSAFVNQYAAFPSLHFAWSLLASMALATQARALPVRLVGMLSPVAVLLAIVVTGNHFLIDAAAGALLAAAALAAVEAVRRFAAWRQPAAYYAHASEEAPERGGGSPLRPRGRRG